MKARLKLEDFLVFDGAMGTMLQPRGLGAGEIPEILNITKSSIVEDIHRQYIKAGCDVITANTFGANGYKLKNTQYSVERVVAKAIELAKKSAGDKYVALDIGPIGTIINNRGHLTFEQAYDIFSEQAKAGHNAGADIALIETMSDVYEAKAAILAVKENTDLPVFCTMTLQKDGRTLMGTDIRTMVNILQNLGVAALGLNCSLGPKELVDMVKELALYSRLPIMVQPNAGLPNLVDGYTGYHYSPELFSEYMIEMAKAGATILGGCCGTEPEHIAHLKQRLSGIKPVKRNVQPDTSVSSYGRTVTLGQGVTLVGERINPTGKDKLKNALKAESYGAILEEAISQRDAGARILDINTSAEGVDEQRTMIEAIKEIQAVMDLPLQIDSTSLAVIEAAARIYNGRPIINSVNGSKKSMDSIFPIAKKYGAVVIGLTLDENGIPAKAEDRVEIASKIIKGAQSYGIGKEDIIIDCLALTIASSQFDAKETLRAVSLVKERLGVKTTLGISNISYGLPHRELINSSFATLALGAGLDAPIVDPLSQGIVDCVNGFNLIWDFDKGATNYVSRYGGLIKPQDPGCHEPKTLGIMVIQGLREEALGKVSELMESIEPMDIVDSELIPALERVGHSYEEGSIFLPQLIQSAEVASAILEYIKGNMAKESQQNPLITKGNILLASVKGDVHDIGKNIAKALLQSYGFEVIDLGKDVEAETIVRVVKEKEINLVGLSALMTTTIEAMKDTIKLLKESCCNCKIMVGSPVLTEEYAKAIGADYYAKDAQAGVKIALEILH